MHPWKWAHLACHRTTNQAKGVRVRFLKSDSSRSSSRLNRAAPITEPCPICNAPIPLSQLEFHVDQCLRGEEDLKQALETIRSAQARNLSPPPPAYNESNAAAAAIAGYQNDPHFMNGDDEALIRTSAQWNLGLKNAGNAAPKRRSPTVAAAAPGESNGAICPVCFAKLDDYNSPDDHVLSCLTLNQDKNRDHPASFKVLQGKVIGQLQPNSNSAAAAAAAAAAAPSIGPSSIAANQQLNLANSGRVFTVPISAIRAQSSSAPAPKVVRTKPIVPIIPPASAGSVSSPIRSGQQSPGADEDLSLIAILEESAAMAKLPRPASAASSALAQVNPNDPPSPCIVCGLVIPAMELNAHVDACMTHKADEEKTIAPKKAAFITAMIRPSATTSRQAARLRPRSRGRATASRITAAATMRRLAAPITPSRAKSVVASAPPSWIEHDAATTRSGASGAGRRPPRRAARRSRNGAMPAPSPACTTVAAAIVDFTRGAAGPRESTA